MRFLVDANLPRRLASAMRLAGHECDHVAILLGPDAEDPDIARAANTLGCALFSKDFDFVDLSQRGVLVTPLIRVGLGNMSARATVAIVLSRLQYVVDAIEAGQRIIEIR